MHGLKNRPGNHDVSPSKSEREKPIPSFSTDYMDRSADPRKEFDRYAWGRWADTHPIPADRSIYRSSSELSDRNLIQLLDIAEDCANDKSAGPGTPKRMVGDLYASAMNTRLIEKLKFSPIEDLLERVSNIRSAKDLAECMAEMKLNGVDSFFDAYSGADKKDSATYAMYLAQGGLSLPAREHYLSDSFAQLRAEYREHIVKMFVMFGNKRESAQELADQIIEIETELAKASRPNEDLRDDEKNYNRFGMGKLDKSYDSLFLRDFLAQLGVPSVNHVIVGQPEFFDALNRMFKEHGLEQWRAYLKWHVISSFAPMLHDAVLEEDFDFFNRKLSGQEAQRPRWKRSISAIDRCIGEALGSLYVDRYFDRHSKQRAQTLVDDLIFVFREKIQKLDWMSDATKRHALEKLDKMEVKIGYPDKFRDYSGLVIKPDDYVGNYRRATAFEYRRIASRVGRPVDRSEWLMTPQTVNAYYHPSLNEIVFPAGILQPPFFDAAADDAVNYGAIGGIIGHEITHGFDDQGRKFNVNGDLKDWWTKADETEFNARANAIAELYSSIEALPGMHINGKLTLGENIADFGGVAIAYEALQRRLRQDPAKRRLIDGLTAEQRFFISWAQSWRNITREKELTERLISDSHSPDSYRAKIPVVNYPEFDKAFPLDNPGAEPETKKTTGPW